MDRLSPREGRGVAFLGEIALLASSQSTLAQAAESCERGVRLLNENAEGTYKTKHAEAARLNYTTTTHRHASSQASRKN